MVYSVYTAVQVICCILTYISLISLLKYKRLSQEYKLLLVVLCFIFIYNVCCSYEMYAQNKEAALLALKIRTICVGQILLFMFKFIRNYCKVNIPKAISVFYWVINVIIIAACSRCQYYEWYFKSIEFVPHDGSGHLVLEPGPLNYLYMFFIISLGLWMLGIVFYSLLKGKRTWNRTGINLFGCIILPFICAVIHFANLLAPFNPTGVGFFLGIRLLITATYEYGMFDAIEGARERIIDTMNQALIIVDENKLFLDANQKAKQMYPLLAKLERGDVLKVPMGINLDDKMSGFEFEQDGHYYEGQVTPVYNEGVLLGYSACIFDITERQHYMEELVMARNEADRANHAKSRFLSNISHELRTPLNAIIGISEIELRKPDLEEETRFDLQSIFYSGQNLLGLVNNLLDISKIEAEKLVIEQADYSFDSLLYEVANIIFTSLRGKNIEFKILVEETVPKYLIGDAVRVRGILTNILANAVKYTKKGHIYLKVFWRTDGDKNSGYLYFIVEDTGIGIKADKLNSIFDEYEQINSEDTKGITGTGLGLSITRQLVRMMDGDIHVKSRYGKGSTFETYIKQGLRNTELMGRKLITKDNIVEILENDRNEKERLEAFPDKRILIVDDMEVNRTVLKGVLEPYQLQIDVADSGKKALQLIIQNDYDLVFMDQMMPEMDGLETLKMIRGLPEDYYKKLPVILVTANVMAEQDKPFGKYGFQDYLTKPLNVRKLVKVLKKWLGDREENEEEETTVSREIRFEIEKEEVLQKKQSKVKSLQTEAEQTKHSQRETEAGAILDRAEGLSHVGGKEELYQEVLKAYYHDGAKALAKLAKVDEMNKTELRTLVHGLKGSSHNIGAMELGNEAERIEIALKRGNDRYAMYQIPAMMRMLEEILDMLPVEVEKVEEKEKKDINEEFVHNLKMLRNEFDEYNMMAVEEMLKELEQFDYGEDAEQKLAQLKDYIQDLEYEEGVRLIDQWLKNL